MAESCIDGARRRKFVECGCNLALAACGSLMNGSVCENCVAATANELGVWRVHHVRFESEADIRTAMEFPALAGADYPSETPGF